MSYYPIEATSISELASLIDRPYKSPTNVKIDSVAAPEHALNTSLIFLTSKKKILTASVVLTTENIATAMNIDAVIISQSPRLDFAKLIDQLKFKKKSPSGKIASSSIISQSASVAPSSTIGEYTSIGPNAVISEGVKIGKNTTIDPGAIILEGVEIGDNCTIQSGAVIGSCGFGYERTPEGHWYKIKHLATVKLGNNVHVGANTTIDRGMLVNTVIGDGVKIDNQCQVAHNVSIGDNTIMAGCSGIAGSTQVGKNCMIGGGVIIKDHIILTDGVIITGGSMLANDVTQPGIFSSGMNAISNRKWLRNHRRLLNLDESLRALEDER